MKQSGSATVVYAAMAANLAIALTKLGAAFYTGSSAMLTESIHSFVDTGDQLLLLYGLKRAARPADESHSFGHGLELFFWSFVVSLLIFMLGGIYAIYEGVQKLRAPEPITSAWINFLVIGLCFASESTSFRLAWKELRQRDKDIGLWTALRRSKDPSTFTVFLEDGAALAGLIIALVGIACSVALQWHRADGIASIGIGLVLVTVAVILARETRSLLTGESASPALIERVRAIVSAISDTIRIRDLRSLQLGSDRILIATTIEPCKDISAAEKLALAAEIRRQVRTQLSAVDYFYITIGEKHEASSDAP